MLITLSFLVSINACEEHRTIFAATFPDGLIVKGEPDPDTIAKIVEAKLDVSWLAERILTAAALAEYAKAEAAAYAEYAKALATALAEYEKAEAAALAEYAKAEYAALAAAYSARAFALAEYEKAEAAALAEYAKAEAAALWRLLVVLGNVCLEYRK